MCGIAGIFHRRDHRAVDPGLLDAMTDIQQHRGPDERGVYIDGGLGLGHRRLSIIDLSSGQQPMRSIDGEWVISYNGEVYNFQELRVELIGLGQAFRTRSDTEVILAAYQHWGAECVTRLRGMFALAIWDRKRQQLFLARDRLGIKPLHYAELGDGTVIFGSELKALLRHPGLKRDLDPQAIEDYFALGYIPDPKTILRSARKLEAGHSLLVGRGDAALLPVRYWDVRFSGDAKGSIEDFGAELIERLREAVRIRMVAEVPLGAFLSGGVDSSAVVAMMAGLSADPVNSCAIGFDRASYDETRYARRVAERYHSRHLEQIVSADDFDLIDRLAFFHDEPFADASALPTYRVSELAKSRVTVALSGDGGDEVFAGYRRHRLHMAQDPWRRHLPGSLRRPLFGTLAALYPKLDWAPRFLRARATFAELATEGGDAYYHSLSVIDDATRSTLFSPAFLKGLGGYRARTVVTSAIANAETDDELSRIQYADLKCNLVGGILTKVDRASMAHGLEVRVPFLDHRLVEWAATLPPSVKLAHGEGKAVLKAGLRPYLDHDLLYRDKMGFVTPLKDWFRGPLRGRMEALVASRCNDELFAVPAWRRLTADHIAGRRDHSRALWSLLMFDASIRHIEGMGAYAG